MNRTGKTRAAQGVEKHYNEYKDFHQQEVEPHVCASFMEMLEIKSHNVDPLVDHTTNLQVNAKGPFPCRIGGCERQFVYHSGRVR